MIKVLTGVHPKDSGQIMIAGCAKEINIKSPQDAQNLGISTVYQEITLCPNLTVAENMYIGRGNDSIVRWGKMRKPYCGLPGLSSFDSRRGCVSCGEGHSGITKTRQTPR